MTLPEDVASALETLIAHCQSDLQTYVETIRAHILIQDAEIAELHKSALDGYEDGWHALRNERDALKAELAKLKARIAEAPVVTVRRQIDGDGDTGKLPSRDDLPADYIGESVRLLREDA